VLERFGPGATLPEEHPPLAHLEATLAAGAPLLDIDHQIRAISHDGYLRGAIAALAGSLKQSPRSDLALRLASELMDALAPDLGIELARAVLHQPGDAPTAQEGGLPHEAANLLLADHFLGRNDHGGALRHYEAVLAQDVDHQRALRGWSKCIRALELRGVSSEHRSRGVALLDGLEALELAGAAGLERYELGRPLGRGRHAVVYEAYDRHVGRQVAIKRLLGDEARQDGIPGRLVQTRFFSEARTLARVRSPHVVALLDAQPRDRFIALELCRGGNLRLALRRGLVEDGDVPRIAAQLRLALAAVHAAGAVHRDIKPANILVREKRPGSDVALADFGLAIEDANGGGPVRPRNRAGTLRYLAPEVRRGSLASAPSDLFSAGVVLLELVSSPRPLPPEFDRVDADFDASSLVPETLAEPLRGAIMRLLSPEPEDRSW
jgi:tRNA A-37 threonylcarbamoyl transferase component Bud32